MHFQGSGYRREGRELDFADFRVGASEPGHQGGLSLDQYSCQI